MTNIGNPVGQRDSVRGSGKRVLDCKQASVGQKCNHPDENAGKVGWENWADKAPTAGCVRNTSVLSFNGRLDSFVARWTSLH